LLFSFPFRVLLPHSFLLFSAFVAPRSSHFFEALWSLSLERRLVVCDPYHAIPRLLISFSSGFWFGVPWSRAEPGDKKSAMKLIRTTTLFLASITDAFVVPSKHHPLSLSSSLNMSSTSNASSLNEAKQYISYAISVGAPAYNAGDVQKCADTYKDAAKKIIPIVPPVFQTKLKSEIEDFANSNPDAKAWALRRIFDSIMDYTQPIVPMDTSDNNISYEQFTSNQIGQPIQVMDNVMGGMSTGQWGPNSNTFSGVTSLANNGGFASIRWRFNNIQNWSYAKGIYIKGLKHSNPDEHTFSILLKDDMCERVRLTNYKAVFANPEQSNQTLYIPFSVFNTMEQMGRSLVGSPVFNPSAVTEIGLMAIKPSVVGDFQLDFDEWGLYML
jgi:hypothetical protein